jgi:hypothetical protein
MKNPILAIAILVLMIFSIFGFVISGMIRPKASSMAVFELAATQVDVIYRNGEYDRLREIAKTAISTFINLDRKIKSLEVEALFFWISSMILLSSLFFIAGRNSAQTDKPPLTGGCPKQLGEADPGNRASG